MELSSPLVINLLHILQTVETTVLSTKNSDLGSSLYLLGSRCPYFVKELLRCMRAGTSESFACHLLSRRTSHISLSHTSSLVKWNDRTVQSQGTVVNEN